MTEARDNSRKNATDTACNKDVNRHSNASDDSTENQDLDQALDQAYESQAGKSSKNSSSESGIGNSLQISRDEQAIAHAQKLDLRKSKFKRIGMALNSNSAVLKEATAAPTKPSEQKVKYVRGPDGKLKKKVKKKKVSSLENSAIHPTSLQRSIPLDSTARCSLEETQIPPRNSPIPEFDSTQVQALQNDAPLRGNTFTPKSQASTAPPLPFGDAAEAPAEEKLKSILRNPATPRKSSYVRFVDTTLTEKEILDEEQAQLRLEERRELERKLSLERERVKKDLETAQLNASGSPQNSSDDGSDIFSDEGSDYNPFDSDHTEKPVETTSPGTGKGKVDYFSKNIGTSASQGTKEPPQEAGDAFIKDALKVATESRKRALESEENPLSKRSMARFTDDGYDFDMYDDDDDDDNSDDQPKSKRKR